MADTERIVLDVDEQPALQGAAKVNKALDDLEKTGTRARNAATRAATEQVEAVVRITDRSKQSIDRLVASVEKRASFAGLSGADRIIAERDQLLKRISGEEGAVRRVTDAYSKLIAAEQQHTSTAAKVADTIRNPVQAASGAIQSLIGRFGGVGLIAGAAAVGIGAFVKESLHLVDQAGSMAEALLNTAERTGLTVGQVDKLAAMSKIAGTSIEALEGSSRILSETLGDSGANGEKAHRALQKLGVTVFDASGKQKELGVTTLEVIEKLSKVSNVAERNALANATLGRSSRELIPLIKQYRELDELVTKRGFGSRDALLEQLAAAGDKVDDLGLRWDLLKARLAKPLTAVVEITTRIVDAVSGGSERNLGIAPGTLGSVTGRQAAGLASHGGDSGSILDRVAAFAEQQAAALRGQDFSKRFASTVEGRQQRLQEIVRQIGDELSKARAGVVGAEVSLNRLNAEKDFLEDAIKRAKEAAEKVRKLSSFQISDEVPSSSNRPREVPSLFSPRERLAFPDGLSSTTFVSNSADRAATAAGTITANLERARALGEGIAQNDAVRSRVAIDAAQREAQFMERKIELLTGPGGELNAVERITQLRLDSLNKQLTLGADIYDIERQRAEVMQDAELRILALQRRRFDEIKDYSSRIFDSLLLRTQSFGDAVKNVLREAFLRPLSDFAANFTATVLTGGRLGGVLGARGSAGGGILSGAGGLAAALGGLGGGGIGFPGAPGGTGGFAGPVTSLPGLIGVGQQGGQLVIPGLGGGSAAAGASGILGRFGGFAGLAGTAGLGLLLGGLTAKRGGLSSASTIGGAALLGSNLIVAGQQLGLLGGAGAGLFLNGLRQGGVGGTLQTIGGGAILGFQYGGPIGAVIGAGVGAVASLIRSQIKTADEKIVEKTKQIYGISIDRKFAHDPLFMMIKQNFGGNIDAGLRSQQAKDLIELYGMSTGQDAFGINAATRVTPRSFALNNGVFSPQPTYWNGTQISLDRLAGSGSSVTNAAPEPQPVTIHNSIILDGKVIQTQTLKAIANNPRAINDSVTVAARQNHRRNEFAGLLMDPRIVTT